VLPVKLTSPVAKSATDSLKTTVKLIGEAPVGSPCSAAWLIVTVGDVRSIVAAADEVTVAGPVFPKVFVTALAASVRATVPSLHPVSVTV